MQGCLFDGWGVCSISGTQTGGQAPQKVWECICLGWVLLKDFLGTLLGPIPNLKRLDLSFKKCVLKPGVLPKCMLTAA